jgi:hypothetical protein
MPKFVIERDMPAGELSPEQMKAAAQKSAEVMREIGQIHWVQSYVTDNRIYCVYVAPDEETICRHAQEAGLPVDRILQVRSIVDAVSAE